MPAVSKKNSFYMVVEELCFFHPLFSATFHPRGSYYYILNN
jgi:hypothetical protein